MLLGVGYSQCDESNWQEYYPDMAGCWLPGIYLSGADLSGAILQLAVLQGTYLEEANLSEAFLQLASLQDAKLTGANLSGADFDMAYLSGADLEGACLEGVLNFTQTDYQGTPILEGCADTWGDGECSYEDTDEDGYDDISYEAGAVSGDLNLDGVDNILDVVMLVSNILNP